MWNREVRIPDDAILEKNNVDVERSGSIGQVPATLGRAFNLEADLHQLFGFELGFSFNRCVEKPGLSENLHGLSRVNRGGSKDTDAVGFKAGQAGP